MERWGELGEGLAGHSGDKSKRSGGSGVSFHRRAAVIDTALLRSPSGPTADLGLDLRCPRMELAHVTHHHEDKHGSSWVSSARTPSSAPRSGAQLGVLGFPREPDAGPIPARSPLTLPSAEETKPRQ